MPCERNTADPTEDVWYRPRYEPCGRPASHIVEERGREWPVCDEHVHEVGDLDVAAL